MSGGCISLPGMPTCSGKGAAGRPQTRCQYDQVANARELIAAVHDDHPLSHAGPELPRHQVVLFESGDGIIAHKSECALIACVRICVMCYVMCCHVFLLCHGVMCYVCLVLLSCVSVVSVDVVMCCCHVRITPFPHSTTSQIPIQ